MLVCVLIMMFGRGGGGHSLYIGDTCVGVGGIDLGWGRGYVAM